MVEQSDRTKHASKALDLEKSKGGRVDEIRFVACDIAPTRNQADRLSTRPRDISKNSERLIPDRASFAYVSIEKQIFDQVKRDTGGNPTALASLYRRLTALPPTFSPISSQFSKHSLRYFLLSQLFLFLLLLSIPLY